MIGPAPTLNTITRTPRSRAALYDEICALGLQAWMTGTGQELFADLGPRARHLSVAEGPDGSVVAGAG